MLDKATIKIIKVKKVKVIGVIPSFAFQRAKYCALELHRKLPQRFPVPEIVGLLELDWNEQLSEWRQMFGREYWCLRRPVAVFFDGKFIGSDLELMKLTAVGNIVLENVPRKNMALIKDHFRKDYISHLKKAKRTYCYLDICIGDKYVGALTFELYSELLPRTCENFKSLCLGNKGSLLSYRGSRIHRIVKGGWIQGGDIQYKTGGGGFSIYCNPLEDECFAVSHDRRGILSMANGGRHQNGSQFFVTLKESKWMDTHYIAFGRLVEGSHVLKRIENVEVFQECPLQKIEIKSCGKLELEDVEDVDAAYEKYTTPVPKKKPRIIETVSQQVIRFIMEALTAALARKERSPDILDDGDVPSKMNLQLYFQGLYSIPEDILEKSAQYLRDMRRKLLRTLKPSATEVVEVLMYDLLVAVLTRITTLDDVRETIGHDLYRKMIRGIDMEFEQCQKPYVKKLVNQIISTAQSMISAITKKLLKMKIMSDKAEIFQEKMQKWVQSFVLQETFQNTPYHISERPPWIVAEKKKDEEKKELPKREGKPCCDARKKDENNLAKLKEKYPSEDICCLGSKLLEPIEINFSDYFKTCMEDIKKVPKEEEQRMPLLDLIEISRFKLKWMRRKQNAIKTKERICVEKRVRKWMEEVIYTPETSWIQDLLFAKDEVVYDHIEEIMYGAMTAGLLEMYYFYEEYLKLCGGKEQKLVERVVYPESNDSDESSDDTRDFKGLSSDNQAPVEEQPPPPPPPSPPSLPPCTCGHPCCVCAFDPKYRDRALTPPVEWEGEEGEKEIGGEKSLPSVKVESEKVSSPCGPGMELVDLNALLAEKTAMKPEEIDIRSFKWLKPYILEKGCDLKTKFATQVHKWIDGERFSCKGFISRHSLVTRASLLSISISLTELITEENRLKKDIRNFIYDLWDLYFNEMFKQALLEVPSEDVVEEEESVKGEIEEEEEEAPTESEDVCKKIIAETPEFDFAAYCARFKGDSKTEGKAEEKEEEEEEGGQEQKVDKTENLIILKVDSFAEKIGEKPVAPKTDNLVEVSSESDEEKTIVEPLPPKVKETEAPPGGMVSEAEREDDLLRKKKRKKSPMVVQELVAVSSEDESRKMPPYILPFWVKFLTELTKQALGAMAKVSRLPRRLYFQTDSDLDFDDKMKEWFDFNAFNPQPTKGREIMDYIALHHKSLDNLEETARSYLKKKKYSQLLNKCTRFASAEVVADEILVDVLNNLTKDQGDEETIELYVSNLISSAIASSRRESQTSYDEEEELEYDYDTDGRYSFQSERND